MSDVNVSAGSDMGNDIVNLATLIRELEAALEANVPGKVNWNILPEEAPHMMSNGEGTMVMKVTLFWDESD